MSTTLRRETPASAGHLPRRLSVAWIVVAIADLGVLAYGILALLDPVMMTAGFETFTDGIWSRFAVEQPVAADFILIGFRLIGAFNIIAGLLLIAIAAMAFREGERWSWWALLVGNTLAIGSPIVYDRAVGYIGAFEILEYVALLAVYAALAATWSFFHSHGEPPTRASK